MSLQLCNNVATTLAAAITTTGQTAISVASATGLPTLAAGDWTYLTLSDGAKNNPETQWEVVKVTAISGTSLTVVRGQDNTSAHTWASGDWIQARPCVQELRDAMALGLTRIGVADANYTITSTASLIISYSSLSTARVLNLPPATQAGQIVWVVDGSGSASASNTITITRAGSDTIEGVNTTMVINAPYMAICLEGDGAGKWALMTYEEIPLILNDAPLTITNREDVIVLVTAATATRALNLPSAITTGQRVTVVDLSGQLTGSINVAITRAASPGTDTINGVTGPYNLATAYGYAELICSGAGKWECSQSPVIASGGSLSTTGAYPIVLAAGAASTVTLPASTSATLAYYTSAPTATNILAYAASTNGSLAYGATANYGVVITSASGLPYTLVGAAGVLVGAAGSVAQWSMSPSLTLPVVSTGVTYTASSGGTTAGEFWYDSTQLTMAAYTNGVKSYQVGCIFTMTATGTNGANTALTNILGTGIGTAIYPASLVGKTLRVRVVGTVITAATPGTTVITLYLYNATASVTVVASAAVTLTASMLTPGWPFDIEFLLTFRTTTTVIAGGHMTVSSSASGITAQVVPIGAAATVACVAARPYTVQVCATNSVASGTIYTAQLAAIEVLN